MNGAGPIRIDGQTQSVQVHIAISAALDLPRPSALALSGCGPRIEITGAPPIAVTRDEHVSRNPPCLGHVMLLALSDDYDVQLRDLVDAQSSQTERQHIWQVPVVVADASHLDSIF